MIRYGISDSQRGVGCSEFIPQLSTENYAIGQCFIKPCLSEGYGAEAIRRQYGEVRVFRSAIPMFDQAVPIYQGGVGSEYNRAKN